MNSKTNYLEKNQDIELEKILNNQKGFDLSQLKDLRHLKTYTIDDNDTFEVDDAISVDFSEGVSTVWVHIASPSEHIDFGSPLDEFANTRSSTLYLAESTIYMFPSKLINEVFSLIPYKDKLALSIGLVLNEYGEIVVSHICRSLISVNLKLSYQDVDEILDLKPKEEFELIELNRLMSLRREFRLKNGAIIIEEPEGKFLIRNGQVAHKVNLPTQSKSMVSESMILFGSTLASYCLKENIDIPYRIQDGAFNVNQKKYKDAHLNNFVLKSSLHKSTNSILPKRHCSLGLDVYTQASSPIRRYIDLLVHYQVVNHLSGKQLLDIDILNQRINNFKINTSQIYQRLRLENRSLIARWFYNSKITQWETVFLRWLNKSEHLALLYFVNLHMDIACFLTSKVDISIGHELIVDFCPSDLSNHRVNFRSC